MKVDELVERLRETAKVGRGAGSNKSSREIADGLDEAADALKAMKEALVEARGRLKLARFAGSAYNVRLDDGEKAQIEATLAKIDAILNQGVSEWRASMTALMWQSLRSWGRG
jgi:hypothetical protein